ncbi:MAG: STAS/SEC14 domain-containing protein [Ignavibacteriales bacterium]|nr:STAS/SEC14 domain-containing protein [Ignavibacteriales bacterium]
MSYSIDASTKFIRVTYSGTLDNNDIQGVLKDSLIVGRNELNLINRIEDMRELHGIKIGFDELMDFAENLRTIQLPQIVKTAILTGNSLQYGIARMFQSILEHQQMEIKIFSNEEEAYNWLLAKE